jgi:2-methylisocitrate lyase-like PEP mutase family enzyme
MNADATTAAASFRRLHEAGDILVLVNVWDAGFARLIESLGGKAIATTSAGVAWAHGYADGDKLPVPLLVATVTDIARVVRVPVTIDVEGGYSSDVAVVAAAVAGVLEAGAVGINIEDGATPPELLSRKIECAKKTGARLGIDLFVNARTDVYLRGLAPEAGRLEEVLRRAALYRSAGADGLFVPGVMAAPEITRLVAEASLPLNVMAWPGLPGVAELQGLGVRRLSCGSALVQALYGRAQSLATAFLRSGDSDALGTGSIAYNAVNALMP